MSEVVKKLSTDELRRMLAEQEAEEIKEREAKRMAYEALKEDTVNELVGIADKLNAELSEFKKKAFDSMGTIYEMLLEYSKRRDADKGNFTLTSLNGELKIEFAKQEQGKFDERAGQAEKHIIDFVERQFKEDLGTKDLITSLLERKKGSLDIKLVQKLYKLEDRYSDASWKEGLKLLKESWQPGESKSYIRFYRKDSNGTWQDVVLSFPSI